MLRLTLSQPVSLKRGKRARFSSTISSSVTRNHSQKQKSECCKEQASGCAEFLLAHAASQCESLFLRIYLFNFIFLIVRNNREARQAGCSHPTYGPAKCDLLVERPMIGTCKLCRVVRGPFFFFFFFFGSVHTAQSHHPALATTKSSMSLDAF